MRVPGFGRKGGGISNHWNFAAPARRAAALLAAAALRAPAADPPAATVEEETARALAADQRADRLVTVEFPPRQAKMIRLAIRRCQQGAPCLDELEVYAGPGGANLALASRGAVARASSVIAGYAIHAVAHLNDGRFGNDASWIPAAADGAWAEIELPAPALVGRVAFARDRTGGFTDRQVLEADVLLSSDGRAWEKAATIRRTAGAAASLTFPAAELAERTWQGVVEYTFLRERETWSRMDASDYLSPLVQDRPAAPGGAPYWGGLARRSPLDRALFQFAQLIDRLSALGLDTAREQGERDALRRRAREEPADSDALYLAVRHAKRRLFLRDPRLAPLEAILFAKRHPLKPSHNYSEHLDAIFAPGGGICVLRIPRDGEGRLDPARGRVQTLFDGQAGIPRDPVATFDAQTVYFAFRPDRPEVEGWHSYWHLWSVPAAGGPGRQLTDGPFHDFDPVPLPDGGLGFMSTRCAVRFLCWRPQAYVLHRMEADGSNLRRLSYANLSEWDPAVTRDGRILWTRSEYLDKGADFGHTLWAIRPDGTRPELVFGNDTPYGYGHAREMPGGRELVCTLISHGDLQGPIVLIDPAQGLYNTAAITSLTPDTRPQYQMGRSYSETFRDPEPVSADHVLVSHNPGRGDHWGLYLIDRYGNRELLYLDPSISSKSPSPLQPRQRPSVFPSNLDPDLARRGLGQFTVRDVYEGLGPSVPRGRAKYLQVSEEVPPRLEQLACGEYRSDHPPFQDFYASPVHLVRGPAHTYETRTDNARAAHAFRAGSARPGPDGTSTILEQGGWPSYVAKAVLGTAPIAEDGSASFTAPAGRVLYFQLLDGDFNELQRMRSVVQLQPGERRSCVGCHEDRLAAPSLPPGAALAKAAQPLAPPPWGAVPFSFEQVVQPVLDARCVRCHGEGPGSKLDLRGRRDAARVPASYRALIEGGWVDHFDCVYGQRHFKAEPLSFGTLRSRLFAVLGDANHRGVALPADEERALKAWVDLNCPLWPDYRYRPDRAP